ncbi:MAG: UvrD-helicase domain-containing protein [Marinilabiliaceae bacterium]
MSQLKIYRASAGSGKTYTLTREFIRLLFHDPYDYRHILAVTFTNKATAEMRQRILRKLFELARPGTSTPDYLQELKSELELTTEQVSQRAALILRLLLHDFSRFSVSTIDRFFQQVMRAFARDAGLQPGFRTELDHRMVMTQAIDRVVLEMDMKGHEALKKWLLDFAGDKIAEGKSWNINREISKFSEEIFKEAYQSVAGSLSEKLADRTFMSGYLGKLYQIIRNYEKQIKEYGEKALKIIENHNLDIQNDFNGGSRSKVLVFKKMADGEQYNPEQVYALQGNIGAFQRKTNSSALNEAIEKACQNGLLDVIDEIIHFFAEQNRDYYTAKAIVKNFYTLGIINDVNQKIQEVSREQNVFILAGTNLLLSRIIQEDEAPFIYERTGARYAHFMIDEFQDTSSLQYANFKPLIKNSLAGDDFSMLVGDVKQSIYRWRNSDWNLLAEQAEQDFHTFGSEVFTLDTNWRSSARVIGFNNDFFSFAASALQAQLLHKIPEETDPQTIPEELQRKIIEAYTDVEQKTAPHQPEDQGHVRFQFLQGENKTDFQEEATRASIEHIAYLLDEGYSTSDICVLVRKKDEGIAITNALLSGEYHPKGAPLPVISNETLKLNSSPAVLFIINHLKYIQNPEDKVLEAFIRLHWERSKREEEDSFNASEVFHDRRNLPTWEEHLEFLNNHKQLPLFDLANELIRLLPVEIRKEQGLYIQGLLNHINDFSSKEAADLELYLEEWENRGQNETVVVPEQQEAIRVMTIHKAKGLEFPAVVMPFCNWELDAGRQRNLMWCKPSHPPFNELDLVPVNYEKSLLESHFMTEYLDEQMHQYIDNLNLLYVAFTRAENSLTGFCQKKKKEPTELGTVSDLLWFHFQTNEGKDDFPGQWDDEQDQFITGTPKIQKKEEKPSEIAPANRLFHTETLPPLETQPFRQRISIHHESSEYFRGEDDETGTKYGKVMHSLFELIESRDDLDSALKRMWFEGKIDENEWSEIKADMEKWLALPEVQNWFDGSYRVLTEKPILHGSIKRPDRVMTGQEETVVVDYKFGKTNASQHQNQVREYMEKIEKMGHSSVKGYIWYVPYNEVVSIEKTPDRS